MIKKELKYLFFSFLILNTFACSNISFEDNLLRAIDQNFENRNIIDTVVVVADYNCVSCFSSFSNFTDESRIAAFYYSNYPDNFLKILNTTNDNLNWKLLENSLILEMIEKEKSIRGPYVFSLKNNKFHLIYPLQ